MNRLVKEFNEYEENKIKFWNMSSLAYPKSLGIYYQKEIRKIFGQIIPKGSSVLEIGSGRGELLNYLSLSKGVGVDFSDVATNLASQKFSHLEFIKSDAHDFAITGASFDFIIISELVNDAWDIQVILENLQKYCSKDTRLIINFYSHLWAPPLHIARKFNLAAPLQNQNWLTPHDMKNLLQISGFEPLRHWQEVLIPVYIPLFSNLFNKYLARIYPFKHLALSNFVIARPNIFNKNNPELSVSIIIAARNEAGHIDELLSRIPNFGKSLEIIFVEGNSTDDTYESIQKTIANNPLLNIKLLKQKGKGKGDAVRDGFDAASGDVLMILDADITVPPEDLPKFYNLIRDYDAEFINGVRLVYPMDNEAMRFANLIGNKFFSWAFSWLLGQPIKDTLCGTKVLRKSSYKKIAANRSYFGEFDPFGDFDLLFGAARLNLKILEVPIRYKARRYGETNISRWVHGWLLLKMVLFAAKKIKFT